jgi:hypothetical protein
MNDASDYMRSTLQLSVSAAPTVRVTADYVVTGAGFLPSHKVTIRITYTTEDISDYINYTTDPGGYLDADLPTSPGTGALHITATDHRADPAGVCGLLWSNTAIVQGVSD